MTMWVERHTAEVRVGKIAIGADNPLVVIAGPCVIESEASALRHAKAISQVCRDAGMPYIFKSSYDKANRTSLKSFRGPGITRGLAVLKRIKEELGLPILSDVHCREDLEKARRVLDIIQIPAFLSRQTDLIIEAARTGKVVNIKKGQFLAPWDMEHVIEKIESAGNRRILLTERGVSFGYNNLVSDFRSLMIMQGFGYPVVYDATHSVQTPSGKGASSGGDRRFIPGLASAAVACGADAVFMEVHERPERAMSDGANMVRLADLPAILKRLKAVEEAVTCRHR